MVVWLNTPTRASVQVLSKVPGGGAAAMTSYWCSGDKGECRRDVQVLDCVGSSTRWFRLPAVDSATRSSEHSCSAEGDLPSCLRWGSPGKPLLLHCDDVDDNHTLLQRHLHAGRTSSHQRRPPPHAGLGGWRPSRFSSSGDFNDE
jgi:hypothetical protein